MVEPTIEIATFSKTGSDPGDYRLVKAEATVMTVFCKKCEAL